MVWRTALRGGACLAFCLVAAAACGSGAGPQPSIGTPPRGGVVERKVDVGGYALYLRCSGTGAPTIVLEAGLAGVADDWAGIEGELARSARVCAYDRAGLGRSDPGSRPRTSERMVGELHRLLVSAGEAGPFLLVAHSFGGFNARLFAARHPAEVAGLVLLDAAHEDQDDRTLAALPPASPGEDPRLARFRTQLATDLVGGPEPVAWRTSAAQVRAAPPPADLPLVVLTAGQSAFPDLPPALADPLDEVRRGLQRDLAARSTRGRQIVAERSGHCIQCDEPALVVTTILTLHGELARR